MQKTNSPADEIPAAPSFVVSRLFGGGTARSRPDDAPRGCLRLRSGNGPRGRRSAPAAGPLCGRIPGASRPAADDGYGRHCADPRTRRALGSVPARNRPRLHPHRRHQPRRSVQRIAGPFPAAAARGLRTAGHLRRNGARLRHRSRPAEIQLPRHDARRGAHLGGSAHAKTFYQPAFLPQHQQTPPPPGRRRRVAHPNQVAPRAGRSRRFPRRRFARGARLRQMVGEVRRLLHAGRNALADRVRRLAQHRNHPRNRPPGPQPLHRFGPARNPLQLSARHRHDGRDRLPLGVVRRTRGKLRPARRDPRRNLRVVPLALHPYRRRRGGGGAMEEVSRLPGDDEAARNRQPAPAARLFHGAARRHAGRPRQASGRVERSGRQRYVHPRKPRARVDERRRLPCRNRQGLPHGHHAERVLLLRHAPDAQ